ncbi:MAG: type II secretion system F family protein [Planctomycetales bacterium]|nr:type II secretion system F family protein [Planctomycetales bacterium]
MFFAPRIRLKALAHLCHRLATATGAGLEDRRIWKSESDRGSRTQQARVAAVADSLAAGNSITEALREAGDYFPPLFHQMLAVGEMSGHLDRTYKQLAQHYDRTLAAQRSLLQRLAWPTFQLCVALFVVGLLIWIMGIIPGNKDAGGQQFDILGLGLIGTSGLVVYLNILIVAGIGILLVFESARRGSLWVRSLQQWALRLPVIGGALKTLALARLTWALQLVFDTPMDLRVALPLALDASGNEYYAKHGPRVARSVQNGATIHRALAETGVFPPDMLDAVAVGEEAGMLAETMRRQSAEYQERAAAAMGIIAQVFGYAMWLAVAGLIIVLIFRIFSMYLGTINSLL